MANTTPYRTALVAFAALAISGSLSCNNAYDLLVHDRFTQAGFNGDVDILWVVDNSNSMAGIQAEVQAHFNAFISQFANVSDEGGQELEYNTVTDAAVAWAEFIRNQERFLNYHMGIVTSDIDAPGNGNQGNIRSEAPIGDNNSCEPTVLTPLSPTLAQDFSDLVDVGVAGSGTEQGMLAAAFAICKSQDQDFWDQLDSRPDTDPVKQLCGAVPQAERQCNAGFQRDGGATVVIMIGDEGDDSQRSAAFPTQLTVDQCITDHANDPSFGECDCRMEWFMDFFSAFGRPVVFATIGPTYQFEDTPVVWCDGSELSIDGPCNPFGNTLCALDFFQQAACLTGGIFTPIQINTAPVEENPVCETADFEAALGNIGALISGLSRGWILSMNPDVETIHVYRNDEEVPRFGEESPSGGWRYVPQDRAIAFSGDQIPGFDERVDIYYFPAFDRGTNIGRDLPF